MTQLIWDQVGQRTYEVGVSKGVLYPDGADGVAWNGLISVLERPMGGNPLPYYIDGVKYRNDFIVEEYQASIEAFTYPDEFMELDGLVFDENGTGYAHQYRRSFGLSYQTRVGNDLDENQGYKIHLIYNALATPTERDNTTVGETLEPMTFKWDITTVPIIIQGRVPTAHLVFDSRKLDPGILLMIETIIYGSEGAPPTLLTPVEIETVVSGWTMPQIYVPYVWEIPDADPFAVDSELGDASFDDTTDNTWKNAPGLNEEYEEVTFSPYMWDLTGMIDFPAEALHGDLGFDQSTGEVFQNSGGVEDDRTVAATFKGTYLPNAGRPYPENPKIGDAYLISGSLLVWLGEGWHDFGPITGL